MRCFRLPEADLATAKSLCIAFEVDFAAMCLEAVRLLLDHVSDNEYSTDYLLKFCEVAEVCICLDKCAILCCAMVF